jgi:hypothetical protein
MWTWICIGVVVLGLGAIVLAPSDPGDGPVRAGELPEDEPLSGPGRGN